MRAGKPVTRPAMMSDGQRQGARGAACATGTGASRLRAAILVGLVGLGGSGCGGGPTRPEYGKEEIVEVSRPDRPEWLGRAICPEGRVCAVGNRTRGASLEHARTDAHNDGLKDFARRLETKASSRFGAARQENRLPEAGEAPEMDQVIKELFTALSRLTIEDVRIEDFWWRRTRALGADQRYHEGYDYAVQLSIPEASWRRKVQALLDRARRNARAAGQEALVRELDDLMQSEATDE